MPPVQDILEGLRAVATDWRGVAMAWHLMLAAFLLGLWRGWRPATARLGALLAAPLLSVAALAWLEARNPFNAMVFTLLAVASIAALARQRLPVALGPRPAVVAGLALIGFGWVYPHFLDGPAWAHVVAAPLGLIPCPTLSAVIGIGLLCDGLRSHAWSGLFGGIGVLYGFMGIAHLGVSIDAVLLAGGAGLLLLAARPFIRPPAARRA